MSPLAELRDDGPLARRVGALAGRRSGTGSFAWISPPAARALEYGGLIALAASTDRDALPPCFALLAALAFHHYDVMYRVRSGRPAPHRWVAWAGGGWEVRILAALALAGFGVLGVACFAAAALLGMIYAGESAAAWAGSEGPQEAEAADPEALE